MEFKMNPRSSKTMDDLRAEFAKEEKKPVMTEEDSIIINVNDGVFIQTRFFQI